MDTVNVHSIHHKFYLKKLLEKSKTDLVLILILIAIHHICIILTKGSLSFLDCLAYSCIR